MCPISFPFCVPLYMYFLLLVLMGLGISFKWALGIVIILGLVGIYFSARLCYATYIWLKRKVKR